VVPTRWRHNGVYPWIFLPFSNSLPGIGLAHETYCLIVLATVLINNAHVPYAVGFLLVDDPQV
jgi:hypothetical protein